MTETLAYFARKFNLDLSQPSPIAVPQAERLEMAQTLAELDFRMGAEIGVAEGHHAEMLCKTIPALRLYCIDPWAQVDGFTQRSRRRMSDDHQEAMRRLSPYDAVIIQKTSMDALAGFTDGALDFVYIDAAHDFRHIAEDVSEWVKKVRPGGILFGHDFINVPSGRNACHVKDVVIAYVTSHEITPWFVLGEGRQRISPDNHRPYYDLKEWMFVV